MKDETLLPDAASLQKVLEWIAGLPVPTKSATANYCRLKNFIIDYNAALQSGNSWQPVTVPAGWIPVSERMPEFNDEVLAWHRHGYPLIAVYSASKDPITYKTYRCLVDNKGHEIDATHWQPLPDAPKGV